MEVSADLRVGCRRGTGLLPPELPISRLFARSFWLPSLCLSARRLPSRRPSPGAEVVQPRRARLGASDPGRRGSGPRRGRVGASGCRSLGSESPQPRQVPAGRGRGWARASPSSVFLAFCNADWCSGSVAVTDLGLPLKTPPPDPFPKPWRSTSRPLPLSIVSRCCGPQLPRGCSALTRWTLLALLIPHSGRMGRNECDFTRCAVETLACCPSPFDLRPLGWW